MFSIYSIISSLSLIDFCISLTIFNVEFRYELIAFFEASLSPTPSSCISFSISLKFD